MANFDINLYFPSWTKVKPDSDISTSLQKGVVDTSIWDSTASRRCVGRLRGLVVELHPRRCAMEKSKAISMHMKSRPGSCGAPALQ